MGSMGFDWRAIERELEEMVGALEALGFDPEPIERNARAIARGEIGPHTNRLSETPVPADEQHVDRMDAFDRDEREAYTRMGREAIRSGRVAAAVLNGGMATRFGGVVKGIVEAVAGRSFLEIKRAQARALGPVPFLVMNSFATHEATLRYLSECHLDAGVHPFLQNVSLRLTPEGELFRTPEGRLSPYAPGHGDFGDALRRAGLVERLRREGVRWLVLSNVDNLGAELDPLVVGYHLARGKPLTVEVARTVPGDVGGAPALVCGRLRVVEGFCFPRDFDFQRVPFMNTNTFVMSLELLREPYPLTWFYVEKSVEGRRAVQMERLVNELSSHVDTAFLATPRSGPQGRFFPTKTLEDLDALRADPVLRRRFSAVFGD